VHATPPTTEAPRYFYSGSWNGAPVTLTPVASATVPASALVSSGSALVGFATNDPAAACLENGPALVVDAVTGSPGRYAVIAEPPADCAAGTWQFTVSPAPASGASTTTTPPTTTTTAPPDTATTSSTTTSTTSTTSTTRP